MKITKPVVLVAPLDWGLGHATRCIPIIRELIRQEAKVIVSAQGGGKILLQNEFPSISFIDIPGYKIRYPAKGSMAWAILIQLPGFLKAIKKEQLLLSRMIGIHHITHVISDNRFGLFSKVAKCTFITHQVKIKSSKGLRFLEPLLFSLNKKRIEKFDELWIPDLKFPENLSGGLSDCSGINIPVKYLGLLSRFDKPAKTDQKNFEAIALLSGPEPQRSLIEKKITDLFIGSGKKCLIIGGVPENIINKQTENCQRISTISDQEFLQLLHPDTTVLCRPGYSTIMDLVVLGHRKVAFIPTPGQTEQEYLAQILKEKYNYCVLSQDDDFTEIDFPAGNEIPFTFSPGKVQSIIENFLST